MVKGEAFLLASLIVVVAIVMMYLPMRKEYLLKQEQMLKKEYDEKIFENVLNEIKNTIYISFYNFANCINNTFEFLSFVNSYVNSKGMSFSSLVILGNISNSLNLTVLNFYDEDLIILFVLNENVVKDVYVGKYNLNSTTFTLTQTFNNVTIKYKDINRATKFSSSNKLLSFIDLKIEKPDYSKRYVDIFVYN